jgi:hypothetical protein
LLALASGFVLLFSAPPAGAATLTQNSSNEITPSNSFACQTAGGATEENSYYRRFELSADHGITTSFTVSSVTFGIEQADDGGGVGQPVKVRLFSIDTDASFTTANLMPLGSQDATVQDSETGTLRTVAVSGTITSPTTTDLVAEVFVPDGTVAGHSFLIGSNASSQTHESYIRAPGCSINDVTPTSSGSLPANSMHIVLFVDGEAAQPQQPPSNNPPPESGPPSNDIGFGKVKLNLSRGTATLPVQVPGPGTLALGGSGIVKQGPLQTLRPQDKAVASASRVVLKIRAKGRKKKWLASRGRVTLAARVTFTPTGGTPNTEVKRVKLRKKL